MPVTIDQLSMTLTYPSDRVAKICMDVIADRTIIANVYVVRCVCE